MKTHDNLIYNLHFKTYNLQFTGDYIQCQTEQDCLDKNMDFTQDTKCFFSDPDY